MPVEYGETFEKHLDFSLLFFIGCFFLFFFTRLYCCLVKARLRNPSYIDIDRLSQYLKQRLGATNQVVLSQSACQRSAQSVAYEHTILVHDIFCNEIGCKLTWVGPALAVLLFVESEVRKITGKVLFWFCFGLGPCRVSLRKVFTVIVLRSCCEILAHKLVLPACVISLVL